MAHLHGSSEAAEQLRQEIMSIAEQLKNLIADESRALAALSESCHDSSYTTMEYIVQMATQKLYVVMPELASVCKRLQAYQELIESLDQPNADTSMERNSLIARLFGNNNLSSSIQSTPKHGAGCTNNFPELSKTNQTWTTEDNGSKVFNTPVETGRKLDSYQGKVNGFLGTCGLVSCVNILRLAGYPATESEVIDYASTTSAGFGKGKLCTIKSFPEDNGGTSAETRQKILQHFGIKSEFREPSVDNIAESVSEGRGVIISVYAGMLYYGRSDYRDLHAITVTSVKKDRNGNVLGFYVCDSGTGGTDNSKFYTAFQVENALSGRPMNVTSIIR